MPRTSRSVFLGTLLASTLGASGCAITAALVGAIVVAVQGEGTKAELRLAMPATQVYQGVVDLSTEWRDAKIVKRNPKRRTFKIVVENRDVTINLKIKKVRHDLSDVVVVASSGKVRMTDDEFAPYILELLCRQLEAKCYRVGSEDDPERPEDPLEGAD